MVQKNRKQLNGKKIDKKRTNPKWKHFGTSKASKSTRIPLILKQALNSLKRGSKKEAQEKREKVKKIKESI